MARTNRLPEAIFAADIKQLLRDINYLKAPQYIGADSLILNLSYTADHDPTGVDWDIPNVTINSFQQKIFTFIFTPDSGRNVYAEFSYSKHVFPSAFEIIEVFPDPDNQDLPNGATAWKMIFTNNSFDSQLLQLDVTVKSTDTGVITWSVV